MGKWNHVAVDPHRLGSPCKLAGACSLVPICDADEEPWPCAAETLRAEARRALEKFGRHLDECLRVHGNVFSGYRCICGFSAALGEEAG